MQCPGDKQCLTSKFGTKIAEVQSEGDVLVVRGELWNVWPMQFSFVALFEDNIMYPTQFAKAPSAIGTCVSDTDHTIQLKRWQRSLTLASS
jgi:hypothetical protein